MLAVSALKKGRGAAPTLLGLNTVAKLGSAPVFVASAAPPAPHPMPLGRSEQSFARLFASLPHATAHEICAAAPGEAIAATGFASMIAALWSKGPIANAPIVWAREVGAAQEGGELYPPGLAAFGLPLERLIIVDAKKRNDALWATEEALKVEGAIAIAELAPGGAPLDLIVSRRLMRAAAQQNSTALIVSHSPQKAPSAAWSRWRIGSAPSEAPARELGLASWRADLLRLRNAHGERSWILEWNPNAACFTENMDRTLAAAPVDRATDPSRRRAG
jgi:protein ImuA